MATKHCYCFLQYATHEFVEDKLTKPGAVVLRCIHCGAPSEAAMRGEQEYEIAMRAGHESEFLQEMAKIPAYRQRWGQDFAWQS